MGDGPLAAPRLREPPQAEADGDEGAEPKRRRRKRTRVWNLVAVCYLLAALAPVFSLAAPVAVSNGPEGGVGTCTTESCPAAMPVEVPPPTTAPASPPVSESIPAKEEVKRVPKPPEVPVRPLKPQNEVNYASITAGAVVLDHAEAFVGSSSLLDDNKDKYARSPCDQPKWVVINLSEDIRVQTIVLANYEKFSSMVKDFQVSYSITLPKKEEDWKELGVFTAKEKQGEQRFTVEKPEYARYLKFRVISHHGNEFFCTLSQIKVHGSTLQQGFMDDWEKQKKITGNQLTALRPQQQGVEASAASLPEAGSTPTDLGGNGSAAMMNTAGAVPAAEASRLATLPPDASLTAGGEARILTDIMGTETQQQPPPLVPTTTTTTAPAPIARATVGSVPLAVGGAEQGEREEAPSISGGGAGAGKVAVPSAVDGGGLTPLPLFGLKDSVTGTTTTTTTAAAPTIRQQEEEEAAAEAVTAGGQQQQAEKLSVQQQEEEEEEEEKQQGEEAAVVPPPSSGAPIIKKPSPVSSEDGDGASSGCVAKGVEAAQQAAHPSASEDKTTSSQPVSLTEQDALAAAAGVNGAAAATSKEAAAPTASLSSQDGPAAVSPTSAGHSAGATIPQKATATSAIVEPGTATMPPVAPATTTITSTVPVMTADQTGPSSSAPPSSSSSKKAPAVPSSPPPSPLQGAPLSSGATAGQEETGLEVGRANLSSPTTATTAPSPSSSAAAAAAAFSSGPSSTSAPPSSSPSPTGINATAAPSSEGAAGRVTEKIGEKEEEEEKSAVVAGSRGREPCVTAENATGIGAPSLASLDGGGCTVAANGTDGPSAAARAGGSEGGDKPPSPQQPPAVTAASGAGEQVAAAASGAAIGASGGEASSGDGKVMGTEASPPPPPLPSPPLPSSPPMENFTGGTMPGTVSAAAVAAAAAAAINIPPIRGSNMRQNEAALAARVRHRCLEQLGLAEFKKQKLSMLRDDDDRAGGGGGPLMGGGSPYDNIFRTLMNEIASLEINQSIFDVYVSNLHNCVVQVVEEMRLDNERLASELYGTIQSLTYRVHALSEMNESYLVRLTDLEHRILGSYAAYFISLCSLGLLLLLLCLQLVSRKLK